MKFETSKLNDNASVCHRTSHRVEVRFPKPTRVDIPLTSLSEHTKVAREYLRGLRAAEMAVWELTGGDYLLSRCAPQELCALRLGSKPK